MRGPFRALSAGIGWMLVGATAGSAWAGAADYNRAIRNAIALLPERPRAIALIDANEATPEVRATLLTLDAFITRGGTVVYIVKQSAVVDAAAHGSRPCELMLAAIIWHEMAHVRGANEPAARRAEQQLWTEFVRDQRIDGMTGLRYLKALEQRSLETHDHHQISAGVNLPLVENRAAVR